MSPTRNIIIITFLSSFLLAGCWNSRELDELALVLAIGIDIEDDQYIFTAEVVNPTMVAGQGESTVSRAPVILYTAKGDSLFEAWRKLTTMAPRKMYFSHVRIVIIGDELAKRGFGEIIDPLLRDHEFRTDYLLVIAKGHTAEELLSILTSLEEIPAFRMEKMIKTAAGNLGTVSWPTLDEAVDDMKSKGKEPVLPSIYIAGDTEAGKTLANLEAADLKARITLDGMAVIKNEKVIYFLDEEDSRGYNYTQGNIKSTVEKLKCPKEKEGILAVEIIGTESKIKAEIKDGKPTASISIKAEANVVDVECEALPQKEEDLKVFQKDLGKHIEGIIKDVISVSQDELKTDFIGIGEAVHRHEPKYWKKHEKEWPGIYPDVEIKVTAEAKIRNIGSINKPLATKGE